MLDKLNKENRKNMHNIVFILLGCTTVYADKLKKKKKKVEVSYAGSIASFYSKVPQGICLDQSDGQEKAGKLRIFSSRYIFIF